MARGNVFGYETHMICEEGFENVTEHGAVAGFQVRLRIANYRGYLLSQVEDIRITVDGESIPRAAIRFGIGDRLYSLDQMENVTDDRWELRQTATITCMKPGGLPAGPHEVSVEEHIRASYLPFTAVAHATKHLTISR